jgi:predicted ATPase
VGREKELRELRARLAGVPLVTLTGPGGIGKTRLAIQVAEKCRNELGAGVRFVDLAGLRDASLVPLAVATALGVREAGYPHSGSWSPAISPRATAAESGTSSRTPTVALQEFLALRQFLLVLDNCEHLVAACATLAEALLSAAPRLRILATSRQPLGLTGETTWPVPPLSLPDADAEEMGRPNARTPECLLQSEAVRLFVERATAVTPAFALTERNVAAVAQLCRRLDGIPLAIELAAARLRALTVEQIAARLDDRFRLLTVGGRTAPPRQQTLRAAMDWSHDLLSEPERILLRRLAVFAGGFTLEAVEAVCADPVVSSQSPVVSEDEGLPSLTTDCCLLPTDDLLDLLTLLVEKSL